MMLLRQICICVTGLDQADCVHVRVRKAAIGRYLKVLNPVCLKPVQGPTAGPHGRAPRHV